MTDNPKKPLPKKERPSDYLGAWGDQSPEEEKSIRKVKKELRSSWK